MDYMFPSRNNKNLLVMSDELNNGEKVNLSQEEDPPLFLQFPSPFLDAMDTTAILPNLLQHHLSTTISPSSKPVEPINAAKPLPSKLKCVRKRKISGKKDRQSKIHTAQGLRDRRMRLSVHTARKFFDLNDMLGFDKASKTIEWLFSKSKKAIEQVSEGLQSDDPTQIVCREVIETESPLSACEITSVMESEKDEKLELQAGDQINRESSRKPIESNLLVPESRERMMIKHLENLNSQFKADPNIVFDQSQLGFAEHPDNHTMEDSSSYPLEYSNTYHFLKHLHLGNTDTYMGNIAAISSTNCSIIDYNKTFAEPPVGCLNSRNTFLGFLGGWDSGNSSMVSDNGIVSNFAPFTGNINGENPSSGITSTSKFLNFHSQNQGQK